MAGNVVRMSQPGTPAATQSSYMKVFIQRDYSEGTSVKFQTRFPPELESRVSGCCCLLCGGGWNRFLLRWCCFKTNSSRRSFLDRSAHIREHDEQTERVFCRGRKGLLQYVLRGLPGVYHRLSNLYLHGDALRKGKRCKEASTCAGTSLMLPISFPVLAQGIQVHCDAERACVQSEGTANHRSGVPGTAGHRDLDTGPPRAHVTAAIAFHRGILYVIRFNRGYYT